MFGVNFYSASCYGKGQNAFTLSLLGRFLFSATPAYLDSPGRLTPAEPNSLTDFLSQPVSSKQAFETHCLWFLNWTWSYLTVNSQLNFNQSIKAILNNLRMSCNLKEQHNEG